MSEYFHFLETLIHGTKIGVMTSRNKISWSDRISFREDPWDGNQIVSWVIGEHHEQRIKFLRGFPWDRTVFRDYLRYFISHEPVL